MTKYVLHGGETSVPSEDNNTFFNEIVKDLEEPINFLCVYFASKKEKWLKLFEQDKKHFLDLQKQFEFILAEDDIDKFIQQIKFANVVYLRGGKDDYLTEVLGKIDNLRDLFKDKVVGASSAGANVLSLQYYSSSKGCVKEGLGILKIKVFCHYNEDKIEQLKELKAHDENIKVYILPEQKHIVLQNKNSEE